MIDLRTRLHLDKAERNRGIARALIGRPGVSISEPPPFDWAVVVGFYAALHYAKAYLWETQRFYADTHQALQRRMRLTVFFASVRREGYSLWHYYRRLRSLADQARYHPHFVGTRPLVVALLDDPLERIRRAVWEALGLLPRR